MSCSMRSLSCSPAASDEPDRHHLRGIVPLIDRARDVEAFVALQADEPAVERGGENLGDLRLADPASPSRNSGRPSRRLRKRTVASDRSATYRALGGAAPTFRRSRPAGSGREAERDLFAIHLRRSLPTPGERVHPPLEQPGGETDRLVEDARRRDRKGALDCAALQVVDPRPISAGLRRWAARGRPRVTYLGERHGLQFRR